MSRTIGQPGLEITLEFLKGAQVPLKDPERREVSTSGFQKILLLLSKTAKAR